MKTCYQLFVVVGLMICSLSLPAAQTTKTSSSSVQQTKLTVNTVRVTDIKSTQAKCSFTVKGTPINEKGVCFSDVPSPTISGKKSMAPGNPTNTGTSILSGLKPATTYYVRAYAKSGTEVFYGNELTFKTLEEGKNSNQNIGQKSEPKPESNKK